MIKPTLLYTDEKPQYATKLRYSGPCCGVVAVFDCLGGVSYREVWAHMGRNKGNAWKGRTDLDEVMGALRHFGARFTEMAGRDCRGSLATWIDQHTRPGRIYLVRVGGHFLTVKDGKVWDQTHAAIPVEHAKGLKRKRVTHAIEITT